MRRRQLLEFAVLGLLHEGPLHGYELRRRLNSSLGPFRALSFGTLYPCLARLLASGWITEDEDPDTPAKRGRITYTLTDAGRAQFASVAGSADPTAWEDEDFDVRLAFFARTEQVVRLRVLEGRRARLEERLALLRSDRLPGLDSWTLARLRHSEESTERELSWLDELIAAERRHPAARPGSLADPSHPAFNPAPAPPPPSPSPHPSPEAEPAPDTKESP